jgi:hypothetical protein
MDRRTFISAIGLYPIGVRAFGPKTQKQPQEPAQSGAMAVSPVERIGKDYECIVGDLLVNQNGHRYPKELWNEIITESKKAAALWSGMYVAWDDPEDRASELNLMSVAGYVTECSFQGDLVRLRIRIADTPKGKLFMNLPVPLFVTPTGRGVIENGVLKDYTLTKFNINNSSAFESATPLVPYVKANEDGKAAVRV